MHRSILKSTLWGGLLGFVFLGWQSWQESLIIELDSRLDPTTLNGIIELTLPHHELGFYQTPLFPIRYSFLTPARLKISLDPPPPFYMSAVYRQVYLQLVAPFQNLTPPVSLLTNNRIEFPIGQNVYTADPIAFARYHPDCPQLSLLPTNQEVMEKLTQEKNALGLMNTEDIVPQLRTLTPPVPVRLWIGWQGSSWRLFSFLGVNFRLYKTVLNLLSHAKIQSKPRFLSLVSVGDIMLGRRIGEAINVRADKGKEPLYPFTKTARLIRNADAATGNLECAVASGGSPQPKKDFTFRAEPKVIHRLKQAGFTILNVANNHSLDYGVEAFQETLRQLHQAGLETVGGGDNYRQAQSLKIVRLKDGTRLGFLSYTLVVPENFAATAEQPGVNWMDAERFKKQVHRARQRCDILVLQFHWGKEYQVHPNVMQRHYGHLAIDYGADLVIGHHPHWIQEMEFYKGKFIAYSLGNFVFDMNHRPKVREGLLLKSLFKDKKLYQLELEPVRIQEGQPRVLPWASKEKRGRETILQEIFQASGLVNP